MVDKTYRIKFQMPIDWDRLYNNEYISQHIGFIAVNNRSTLLIKSNITTGRNKLHSRRWGKKIQSYKNIAGLLKRDKLEDIYTVLPCYLFESNSDNEHITLSVFEGSAKDENLVIKHGNHKYNCSYLPDDTLENDGWLIDFSMCDYRRNLMRIYLTFSDALGCLLSLLDMKYDVSEAIIKPLYVENEHIRRINNLNQIIDI